MALFSEPGSLEISLHGPAGNRPRADVAVYVITALNRTGRPVSQYNLQAVCDKVRALGDVRWVIMVTSHVAKYARWVTSEG